MKTVTDRIIIKKVVRFLWWDIRVPLWIHDPLKGVDNNWEDWGSNTVECGDLDPGQKYSVDLRVYPYKIKKEES